VKLKKEGLYFSFWPLIGSIVFKLEPTLINSLPVGDLRIIILFSNKSLDKTSERHPFS
jgi:hypothetical protein